MVDFEEAAEKYAYQLTEDPPESLAKLLEIAAQEYHAGLSKSDTETRQTEMLQWITKPGAAWKLSGWKAGMPGALTTRAAKAVKLLRRGPGRSPKNWAAESFIPSMINVAAAMEIKASPPYWNEHEDGWQSSKFSRLCDGWLCVIAHDAEISPQTYRDILKALE